MKGVAKLRPDDDPALTKVSLGLSRREGNHPDTHLYVAIA